MYDIYSVYLFSSGWQTPLFQKSTKPLNGQSLELLRFATGWSLYNDNQFESFVNKGINLHFLIISNWQNEDIFNLIIIYNQYKALVINMFKCINRSFFLILIRGHKAILTRWHKGIIQYEKSRVLAGPINPKLYKYQLVLWRTYRNSA